jgi:hypothetical protein
MNGAIEALAMLEFVLLAQTALVLTFGAPDR